MCWITFSAASSSRHKHRRVSLDAELDAEVDLELDVEYDEPPRFVDPIIPTTSHTRPDRNVRIITPTLPLHKPHLHHHHHHHPNHHHHPHLPHLHHLPHMPHPHIRHGVLRGHGVKRAPPPPPPPPPSPQKHVHFEWDTIDERVPRQRGNEEQRYRTVVTTPFSPPLSSSSSAGRSTRPREAANRAAVRSRTREAILEVREPGGRRLRRVPGRGELSAETGWRWEVIENGRKGRYPPFGDVRGWM